MLTFCYSFTNFTRRQLRIMVIVRYILFFKSFSEQYTIILLCYIIQVIDLFGRVVVSNLLIKLKNYIDFKDNKLVKFYLLFFYILNVIYLYLEISNNKLAKLFNAYPEQQEFYFIKMQNITNQTSFTVNLLMIINVIYLLLSLIKYRNKKYKGVNEYLIISFISLLSIKIISSILHVILSTNYLLEPTFLVTEITIVVLIITLIKIAYKFLLSKSKHETF